MCGQGTMTCQVKEAGCKRNVNQLQQDHGCLNAPCNHHCPGTNKQKRIRKLFILECAPSRIFWFALTHSASKICADAALDHRKGPRWRLLSDVCCRTSAEGTIRLYATGRDQSIGNVLNPTSFGTIRTCCRVSVNCGGKQSEEASTVTSCRQTRVEGVHGSDKPKMI